MNSVKNLLVVVLLMGVSYGAFQVINTPDPTLTADAPVVEELDTNGPRQLGIADPATDAPVLESPPTPQIADKFPPTKPEPGPAAEAPGSLPSLPPEFQSQKMTNPAPELVAVPPTSPAGSFEPATPTRPDNPFPPKETAPAPLNANNNTVANSNSFVPQSASPFPLTPQTNLQPVNPKPDANDFQQPLNQNTGPARQQANQLAEVANEIVDEVADHARTTYVDPSQSNMGIQPSASPIPNTSPALSTTMGQVNWTGIADMANNGNVKQALAELSQRYNDPLPADQRMQMLSWLDQLAGKVIYSTEHHLQARPYIVADGDTLESIAARWNIPPQLVYNINRSKFGDSTTPAPGTELKVVQGPFNAQISLDRMEMTLFLDGMYAGRFSVELGKDHQYEYGSFMIETKSPIGKDYTGPAGQIAAGAPNNPYGKYWLGFSNSQLCIHEAPDMGQNGDMSGCIRVAARDAEDIYGILSEGSQVSIMR